MTEDQARQSIFFFKATSSEVPTNEKEVPMKAGRALDQDRRETTSPPEAEVYSVPAQAKLDLLISPSPYEIQVATEWVYLGGD